MRIYSFVLKNSKKNSSFSALIIPLVSLTSKHHILSLFHPEPQSQIESLQMPTLQKFKLFATQCAAVNIPTQSPTTSPLFHLRRRKTLRMFLTRLPQISDPQSNNHHQPTTTTTAKRSKLRDLFFSASSSPTNFTHRRDDDQERKSSGIEPKRTGLEIGPASVRPLVQLFGCRNRMLLTKPWRPVLSTTEEVKE